MRNMFTSNRLIAVTTLTPAALLALAAFGGGIWVWASLLYMTVFVALLDRVVTPAPAASDGASGTALSASLALVHFCLLVLILRALVGDTLGGVEKLGLFLSAGFFFGQVSNANAHELIHRPQRMLHRLGMWVYISLLFGHHTSAHLLVHHTHVATRDDPNTARKGEGFYSYAIRAWIGSFQAGHRAEAARLARRNRSSWMNPYVTYVSGAAACLLLSIAFSGAKGGMLYLALAGHAQMQLLMSDYVQHYGLTRRVQNGKPEAVNDRHSWNSRHPVSTALMLNATRHSDHHTHPARPYPDLTLSKESPMLPRPLPVMAGIALLPPLWRRIMDPCVDRWQNA